jgi:MFS family permease
MTAAEPESAGRVKRDLVEQWGQSVAVGESQVPRDGRRTGVATNVESTTARRPRNGVGVAALVVGIVSLVLAILIIFFPLAGLLGIIAMILGGVGMARASRGEADNRGQALGGLVTGLIALVIAIALGVGIGSFFAGHVNDFRKLGTCFKNANTHAEKRACANTFGKRISD